MKCIYTVELKMIDGTTVLASWPTTHSMCLETMKKEFRRVYRLLPAEQIDSVVRQCLMLQKLDKPFEFRVSSNSRDDAADRLQIF